MSFTRSLTAGLRNLFRRENVDRELDEEISHFVDLATQEHIRAGMSPEDARRAARVELGSYSATRTRVRLFGWEMMLQNIASDLHYAVRRLRHSPGFTFVAVLSIALGIGANTAVFSIVNAALLRPLPVEDPERLVALRGAGQQSVTFSYPDFADVRDQLTTLTATAAWAGVTVSMGNSGDPELVTGVIATGDLFPVLGVHAARGRLLGKNDDVTPGGHPVAVISDGLWRRKFGRSESAIGQSILLNGIPFTIVGVLPARFEGLQPGVVRDIYVPMMMQTTIRPPRSGYSGEMNPDLLHVRTNRWLFLVGRMKPGVAVAAVNADLARADRQLAEQSPNPQRSPKTVANVLTLRSDDERGQLTSIAKLLLAVVGAVLLIACANVANLLLSRATSRRREIAVRLAIGATRTRLVRQLLAESVLLASVGGAAGLALAWSLLHLLRTTPPPAGALPLSADIHVDPLVLLFTCGLALLSGIGFGLVPALRASRPDLVPALKDEQYVATARGTRWSLGNLIVVGQIALSVVLLVSASLFVRSLDRVRRMETGLDVAHIVTVPLSINLLKYTSDRGRIFYKEVTDRVGALPGVRAASVARWVALAGNGSVRALNIEGRAGAQQAGGSEGGGMRAGGNENANVNTVGLRYFDAMGIPLQAGRDFTAQDEPDHPGVAIVNRAFVAKHFPDEDPLAKRISVQGPQGPWLQIVGVVATSKAFTIDEAPTAVVYIPEQQSHETGMVLHVRTAGDPGAMLPAIEREVHTVEKNLPLSGARTMTQWLALALYQNRAETTLLSGFSAIALILAAVGLYGVMAYSVARRTRELGLRMALGANAANLVRQVVREGVTLLAAGLVLGMAGAFAVTGLLRSFLFGMDPIDAPTFIAIPLLLTVVTLAACALPAWRATKASPMLALRSS